VVINWRGKKEKLTDDLFGLGRSRDGGGKGAKKATLFDIRGYVWYN
jgi:hypothetical protein